MNKVFADIFLLTTAPVSDIVALYKQVSAVTDFHTESLLFRVVEVHRTCEATATPETEGANLSE